MQKDRGKRYYFGRDWKATVEYYQAVRDDLQAGRNPTYNCDGCTVADMVNTFLTEKQELTRNCELSPRTFGDYRATGEMLARVLGCNRLVEDLRPDDFRDVRTAVSRSCGHVRLTNEIIRCRSFFKFAWINGLIDRPVKYGSRFDLPSKRARRLERQQKCAELTFSPDDIHKLIGAAGAHL